MTGERFERRDLVVAAALAAFYLVVLASTTKTLGYMRDEGFYVYCARALETWFDHIGSQGTDAFARASIDRYFDPVHEHPALMKLLFAASHRLLHERFPLFAESGDAYRLPGMAMGSLAVAVLYLWGTATMGRLGGAVAALSFAWMPHVFFHAHLACLDVAVAAMWLLTSFLYARAFDGRRWPRLLAVGVAYGLFLNTKHNAWMFPFALALHLGLVRLVERRRKLPRTGPLVPWALVSVVVLGPLVLWLTWPWLWFDTGERVLAWFEFHLGHDYYNMEFLGRTYWKPPMPRLYAWVMTLGTVPLVTLVLGALGLFDTVRAFVRGKEASRVVVDALWLVGIATSYAPWWSSDTPIFGGTKHWLTAYPFLCLLAGRGFVLTLARVRALLPERPFVARALPAALAAAVLVGPCVMAVHAHPYGLSFYTPLVGGVPGAASLGLNRTFWGYTTGVLAPVINRRAPPGAGVYVHDTALQSWELLRADGRVRSDLNGTLALHASELALYHHEPHMRRVEFETWVLYGTVAPVAMAVYDGVPMAWLYQRPRKRSEDGAE
ncbi:MAG TPA: glycosyltransferase family 39 protein [Polyangiaceae bacterium]|nr:glycosyltransferase family 39 protein [Polyangiaceae bacterium]